MCESQNRAFLIENGLGFSVAVSMQHRTLACYGENYFFKLCI